MDSSTTEEKSSPFITKVPATPSAQTEKSEKPVEAVQPKPSTPSVTPVAPAVPSGVTPPVPANTSMSASAVPGLVETKSNKMVYLVVFLLLLVLVGLSGLFFYKQFSSAINETSGELPIPTTEPNATPTIVVPTYKPESPEEEQVDAVQLQDVDPQLRQIEQKMEPL